MTERKALMAAVALVVCAGCEESRQSVYTAQTAVSLATPPAPQDENTTRADELWAQREDPKKLHQALGLYEKIAAAHPSRRDILARLSRGYYLMAYGCLSVEEEVLAAYDKGAGWGERILGLHKEFRERIAAGKKDYQSLGVTTREDVPGIYWVYANMGKWSVAKGFITVVKNKSKLKAFIDRVAELAPEFYYGAGDRGLGAYYAKAPSFAGGDLDKSCSHFNRSLKIAPNYFGTKVLMAEYYTVKTQDRALFERLLGEVLNGDPNVLPNALAIQKIEQRKARELLARVEDLFE